MYRSPLVDHKRDSGEPQVPIGGPTATDLPLLHDVETDSIGERHALIRKPLQ
jgi:hypothetical protein